MADETAKSVFKNAYEKGADRRDETTRASQEIVNKENAARDAKSARLKAARLERDTQDLKTLEKEKSKSSQAG